MKKLQKGFTLIELMIVVAVIGLLASIGYPNYKDYVTRGKIAEATSQLSDGRIKMEQYFQDNRTYNNTLSPATAPAVTSNFSYSLSSLTASTYMISASGSGAMTGFTYTIDQNNAKQTSATNGWGTSTTCWVTKKGGLC